MKSYAGDEASLRRSKNADMRKVKSDYKPTSLKEPEEMAATIKEKETIVKTITKNLAESKMAENSETIEEEEDLPDI